MRLNRLVLEVGAWQSERFSTEPITRAAKVAEEAGEVCGAVIKRAEGRRTTQDVRDEIGDTLVALAGLAAALGEVDLEAILSDRWAEVRERFPR